MATPKATAAVRFEINGANMPDLAQAIEAALTRQTAGGYAYRATCVEFPALDNAAPAPSLPGEVPVLMCQLPSGQHPKYPGLELRRVAILWRRPKDPQLGSGSGSGSSSPGSD